MKTERKSRKPAGLGKLDPRKRKLYEAIPEQVDYVDHPSFQREETENKLFGPEAEQFEVPHWRSFAEPDEADLKSTASGRTRLSRSQEELLFLRYNYACFRLAELQWPQRRRFSIRRAREMVRWFERILRLRADLVGANMALVVAMAKRTRINSVEFAELVSEGNMALLRSVEKFDCSRGFKFSTYACRAILKAFNRLATKTGNYRQHFPTEFDPDLEQSDELERRHTDQRELALEDLDRILRKNLARLTRVEHAVVAARFAVAGHPRPQTLEQVGRLVGLSKERVRQVQNDALVKLRGAFEAEVA
jgi:RNA polymerase sigma factor (sigma-70 family)